MALDPIKIPQNVYIEDRIVGPLTLKQVITVALGAGFSYGLWAMLNRVYGALPLPIMIAVWLPAVLSFAFAFIRINDLSLLKIALLMVEQMEKPKIRTWAPRQGIVINIRTFTNPNEGKQKLTPKAATPIDQITQALDVTQIPGVTARPVSANAAADGTDAENAEAGWRRPVNQSAVRAEPLRTDATVDGVAGTPRSSLFRDLSPA